MVTEEFPAEMLKSYLDSMYKVEHQWVSDFVLAHSIAQPLMNTVSVFLHAVFQGERQRSAIPVYNKGESFVVIMIP